MRVAVTGAGGRLGSALVRQLSEVPFVGDVLAWDLPKHDLDDPGSARRLVSAHRPDAVVHAAAWTDVDGCARDPALAMRRNGTAVGEMAEACVDSGAALVMVSTNEVFDGLRADGVPYRPADGPHPMNPYGQAKLAGEQAARAAYGAGGDEFASAAVDRSRAGNYAVPRLAIVRTAWLFGLPGADFPQKILAGATRARAGGASLKLVSDEIGCPTYATDLASAIVAIVANVSEAALGHGAALDHGAALGHGAAFGPGRGFGGIHHVVNAGHATRAEWAREVLRLAGVDVPTEDVPMTTWPRPSTPPAWGVLEPTPLPDGPLRDWHKALAEYMRLLPQLG